MRKALVSLIWRIHKLGLRETKHDFPKAKLTSHLEHFAAPLHIVMNGQAEGLEDRLQGCEGTRLGGNRPS